MVYAEHHSMLYYHLVIIPRGLDNIAAITVISKHVSRQLNDRGFPFLRSEAGHGSINTKELPETLKVIKMTHQLKAIHTKIRNTNTSTDDFIFYSDRLARIVIEKYHFILIKS